MMKDIKACSDSLLQLLLENSGRGVAAPSLRSPVVILVLVLCMNISAEELKFGHDLIQLEFFL